MGMDLEHVLSQASSRTHALQSELKSYLEKLRSQTFAAEGRAEKLTREEEARQADDTHDKELLVSMPADFEDVVDMNARLSKARRQLGAMKPKPNAATNARRENAASQKSNAAGTTS